MTHVLLRLAGASAIVSALLVSGCDGLEGEPEGRARAQEPSAPALECFDAADRNTRLIEQQALRLCWGARSTGPVQCFRQADDETTLTDDVAIELCRCAEGIEPVACYLQYSDQLLLNTPLVVEWCRPIRVRQLTSDCIPVREL